MLGCSSRGEMWQVRVRGGAVVRPERHDCETIRHRGENVQTQAKGSGNMVGEGGQTGWMGRLEGLEGQGVGGCGVQLDVRPRTA